MYNQIEPPSRKEQGRKRADDRILAHSPIIMHRIQRADWLTGQFSNLLIVCGRFLRKR